MSFNGRTALVFHIRKKIAVRSEIEICAYNTIGSLNCLRSFAFKQYRIAVGVIGTDGQISICPGVKGRIGLILIHIGTAHEIIGVAVGTAKGNGGVNLYRINPGAILEPFR